MTGLLRDSYETGNSVGDAASGEHKRGTVQPTRPATPEVHDVSPSILVVEDEPSIARSSASTSVAPASTCVSPATWAAALEEVQRHEPDLNLDLMLPKVDGYEVTRRLREKGDTPIIMLTARKSEADRIAGLEMGADDYVVKPFSAQELVSRVRAVLNTGDGCAGRRPGRRPSGLRRPRHRPRSPGGHGPRRGADADRQGVRPAPGSGPPPERRLQPGQAPQAGLGVGGLHRPEHGDRARAPRARQDRGLTPEPRHCHGVGRRLSFRAMSAPRRRQRDQAQRGPLAAFVAGSVAAVVVALLVFALLMRPPEQDFVAMSALLGMMAPISVGVGVAAARLGWMRRSPKLAWTLMGGYLLAAVLTFLNVLFSARLMFLNRHDLLLASVLLVFAGIIAASLGYLLSGGVVAAVARLNRAAGEVAAGDLDVLVPVDGSDEVAALAASFNEMTRRLREAEAERVEVETARRDLLTAVGHDLRTPLASARVILEALSDGVVDDPCDGHALPAHSARGAQRAVTPRR